MTSFEPDFKLNTKILHKLHFRLIVLFFLFNSILGFSIGKTKQEFFYHSGFQQKDSIPIKDTTKVIKKQPLEDPIFYNAKDSTIYSLDGKKIYLFGDGVVNYQKIELKAQYIEFDMEKKEVFAKGIPDSTGKVIGSPIFKDGGQTYTMNDIFYNFNSKKAKINGVITEQNGGFVHSDITKKMGDNSVNLKNGKFTSCNLPHPHFYIAMTKGKVIPNDKIIFGPSYLVIEDVPFPLVIPFGYFPNTRQRSSGIIIPEYGEEIVRGVFLRGGGFYFGISDYFDLKLTTDIYSFGSWAVHSHSTYKKRYRFSGNLGIDVSKNILNDSTQSTSYNIVWTHTQDSKASPNSNFSASVNFGSTDYNHFNSSNLTDYLSNQVNSSINYSKTFVGTPFRMSTAFTHSQNNRSQVVSVDFPRVSISMDKIYPFKRESEIGAPAWYEKIGISVNTSIDNKVAVKEKNLFKRSVIDSMSNGIKHEIPLMTSFNLLKFIQVSPSVYYSEFWYASTIRKNWVDGSGSTPGKVVEDTVPGFRRAWQYSTGVSMSTKIYGMFNFGKDKAIQAIRHVLTPTISISYRPDFSDPSYGFYKTYQTDQKGNTAKYSIFERGVYGSPGAGKSGMISFGLGNNLEMKVRSSKDTINNFKKIKIFENLSFNSSYNLLADSMKLQPISFTGSTRLFDKININFNGVLNPYALNNKGVAYNAYEFNTNGKFARLTSFSIGVDFSLNSAKKDKNSNKQTPIVGPPPNGERDNSSFGQSMSSNNITTQSVDFEIPWNLRVNYNFNYSKPAYEKSTNQTLGFSGDLSLTPKWKIGFSSGYDFQIRKLSTTSINIYRDLHCWEMRLTLIPLGFRKMYSFQINVKSGMLQDLKWTKRDSYLDNL